MGSQSSLKILNVELQGLCEQRVFYLFPDLPKELRLQVWEAAIPRERMIHISLQVHGSRRYELAAAEPRYLERNALRKPISGERYRAVAQGEQLNSKFLRVSSEARQVALAFYRVHIPIYLSGPTRTERTTLIFNPEHDFLHIRAEAPVKETLIDFLWDLKAYDPKDVGLLRLATDLDGFCANDLPYLKRSDLYLIRQRMALVDTLSQLKEVWFINLHSPGRARKQPEEPPAPQRHFINSGALPIAAGLPTLERVGADPRSGLGPALERLYLGDIDPREMLFRWRRLLRTWDVSHAEGQVAYRVLFATTPERRRQTWRIKELDQAMEFLTLKEHEHEHAPSIPTLAAAAAQDRIARTTDCMAAIGFWLFPVESVGQLGEGDRLADMDFYPGRVLDMREYWPELVISKLP